LFPGNLPVEYTEIYLAVARGEYAAAARHARRMADGSPDDELRRADGYRTLADLALLQGKLAASVRDRRTAMHAEEEGGFLGHYLLDGITLAAGDVWVRKTPPSTWAPPAMLVRYPLDSIPPLDRPYVELAGVYSGMGHPERAIELAADFTRHGLATGRFGEAARHHILGAAALAGTRYGDAVLALRQAAAGEECPICALPELAQAYDLGGAGDSAIAVYERYLETPWIGRLEVDAVRLAPVYERLGELYEARHEPERAATMYRRMIALWREADPELRPRVAAVERRLAALTVERK
jgi:tetratricopeptide (TPR) repeat protein